VAVSQVRAVSIAVATAVAFFVSFMLVSAVYFAVQIFVIGTADPKFGTPLEFFGLVMYLMAISAFFGAVGFAFGTLPFPSWRALPNPARLWLTLGGAFLALLVHVTGISVRFIYPVRPRVFLPAANLPQHLLPGLLAGLLAVLGAYLWSARKAAAT
jgi:hypothetical protein